MRRSAKRSSVWEYFRKDTANSVICEKCKKGLKFAGNTSNLRDHLRRKHPGCLDLDGGARANTISPESETSQHQQTSSSQRSTSDEFYREHSPQPSTSSGFHTVTSLPPPAILEPGNQEQISSVPKKIKRKPQSQMRLFVTNQRTELTDSEKEAVDSSLIKMIALDYQPLSIVEDIGFLEYSKKLQPLYKPPNRKLLSSVMLPKTYQKVFTRVSELVKNVDHVAVTTDIWSSDSNKAFLTLTCHFVHNDEIYNPVLANIEISEAHTGANLASALSTLFQQWSLQDKIVTIISDNGANIKNAINEHLKKWHHPCVAHTLNLCVTDSIHCNDLLTQLLKKCRAIVGHFKHSVVATEKLKNMQKQMGLSELKVKQDVPTRWNSSLIMLERLLAIKEPLSAVITSLPKAPEFLSAAEWDILVDCVRILKPVEKLTVVLSGEKYPTMSLIIPLIKGLQYSIKSRKPLTACGKNLQEHILEVISRRLGILESNTICGKSTFLDPRFKKEGFGVSSNADSVQKMIINEVSSILNQNIAQEEVTVASGGAAEIQIDEDEVDIWAHFDEKVAKLKKITTPGTTATLIVKQYLEMPLIQRTENPLEFWRRHKVLLPELYQLHLKYSGIPATSVPSERVFSKSGQIINDRRNRLLGKNLNMIIFLNSNIQLFG